MKKVNHFRVLLFLALSLFITSCSELLDKVDDKVIEDREITENITENTTWESGKTYVIDGTIRVGGTETVILTIEPGATIKFTEGSNIDIAYWDDNYATVIAKGTADDPIKFTSKSVSKTEGDWGAVSFYSGAEDCIFEYCEFEYGGSNDYYGNIYIEETNISFSNCTFSNSETNAIVLKSGAGFSEFSNNSFYTIGNYPISIYPAFIHTIGDNNSYESNHKIYVDASESFTKTGKYTWKNQGIPLVFDGSLRIGTENTQGLEITINEGVVLNFTEDSYIDFAYWDDTYATLISNGTKENPVKFTANSPSPDKGDWNGINFYKGAINCSLNYTIIEFGGSNDYYGNMFIEETAVALSNCTIKDSEFIGIRLIKNGEFTAFNNNTLSGHNNYPISIFPNAVHTLGIDNAFEEGSSIYIDGGEGLTNSGTFTWLNQGAPYTVDGTMRIGSINGTQLNISEGTTVQFSNSSTIEVAYWGEHSGDLIANGSAAKPITFTSKSMAKSKGDWQGIGFYNGVAKSKLNYCTIEYAGSNDYYGAIALDETGSNTVQITNSTISNSQSHAITVDDDSSTDYSTVTFVGNEGEDYHVR